MTDDTFQQNTTRKNWRESAENCVVRPNSLDLKQFKLPPETPNRTIPTVWTVGSGFDGVKIQPSTSTAICRPRISACRRLPRFSTLRKPSCRPLELFVAKVAEKESKRFLASDRPRSRLQNPVGNSKTSFSRHGKDVADSLDSQLPSKSVLTSKLVSQLYDHLTQSDSSTHGHLQLPKAADHPRNQEDRPKSSTRPRVIPKTKHSIASKSSTRLTVRIQNHSPTISKSNKTQQPLARIDEIPDSQSLQRPKASMWIPILPYLPPLQNN